MAHFEAKYKIGALVEYDAQRGLQDDTSGVLNHFARVDSVTFVGEPIEIFYDLTELNTNEREIRVAESRIVAEIKRA